MPRNPLCEDGMCLACGTKTWVSSIRGEYCPNCDGHESLYRGV